jgi:NTE family protein
VLDAFLEDGRLRFDGVSGTSAGAMNAVALAHGLMVGGAKALQAFWHAVARSLPLEVAVTTGEGPGVRLAPGLRLLLQWSHYFSPEQLNPFDLNPLRDVLSAQIDFSGLRTHSPLQLVIAATQVNTGKLRLFRNAELSVDAVLASACLPTMHRTDPRPFPHRTSATE